MKPSGNGCSHIWICMLYSLQLICDRVDCDAFFRLKPLINQDKFVTQTWLRYLIHIMEKELSRFSKSISMEIIPFLYMVSIFDFFQPGFDLFILFYIWHRCLTSGDNLRFPWQQIQRITTMRCGEAVNHPVLFMLAVVKNPWAISPKKEEVNCSSNDSESSIITVIVWIIVSSRPLGH